MDIKTANELIDGAIENYKLSLNKTNLSFSNQIIIRLYNELRVIIITHINKK